MRSEHPINQQTVLVIDGGGRGAALVHAYAQSPHVQRILAVPGNDGMKINTKKPVEIFPHLKTTSTQEILALCKEENVSLVDVAQDNAIEAGLVDRLFEQDIPTVGPTKSSGQIEWDKAWSRKFMQKYHLPIPTFTVFNSVKDGISFVKRSKDTSWFVKASGLAEGKGVISAKNNKEAIDAIQQMANFKKAGSTYVLEDWLVGEEFSAFALPDGKDFIIAGYAQDHKRVYNFDEGENTGGMGCVSSPLVITNDIKKQVQAIFQKTFDALQKEKRSYTGVLYLGGMVVNDKVMIIEFNARWGDPEAEVIIPSIQNDFYEVSIAITQQTLKKFHLRRDHKVRVVVAAAARGYPKNYDTVKGKRIYGLSSLNNMQGARLYTAGIKDQSKQYYVNGGRLFYVVGEGKDVIQARKKVYTILSGISIEGNNLHYRTDIGFRDVERLHIKL